MNSVQCTLTNLSEDIRLRDRACTRAKIKRALRSSMSPILMTEPEAAKLASFIASRLHSR